ncbi:MAG: transcriptional regulator BetI [Mangrovicoccus sp.]|nr:transcriptional regulator BetI [Mangrovicoccus sp.]
MSVEAKRKAQLVQAAITEIGMTGSMDVPVGKIAKRAGVSAALAFHYFGDKDRLFLAALRHVLTNFGMDVRASLATAHSPRARLEAVVAASFHPVNFDRNVVASWLNFYVFALRSEEAARLLAVYHHRLHSNLVHDLKPLIGADAAPGAAKRLGAVIDGLYLRCAAQRTAVTADEATALALTALSNELAQHGLPGTGANT